MDRFVVVLKYLDSVIIKNIYLYFDLKLSYRLRLCLKLSKVLEQSHDTKSNAVLIQISISYSIQIFDFIVTKIVEYSGLDIVH